METENPAAEDLNTLLVQTRDLNKNVPQGQNLLGDFGNFGVTGVESTGLPKSGDIIFTFEGVPHIRTNFGKTKTYFVLEFHFFYFHILPICKILNFYKF